MTRRSLVVPAAILGATVVAAVAVLLAGGPDRVGLAMILLVGVPVLLATGAGSDQGWRAMSRLPEPPSAGTRLASVLPVVVVQVAVLVLVVRQAAGSVAAGDVVGAVALVPFALLLGWRGWQLSRRIGAWRARGRVTPAR
jgi:hypothetical protein